MYVYSSQTGNETRHVPYWGRFIYLILTASVNTRNNCFHSMTTTDTSSSSHCPLSVERYGTNLLRQNTDFIIRISCCCEASVYDCYSECTVTCVTSLLQVDLPEDVSDRFDHTATIVWSSQKSVMVVVYGGQSGVTLSDTTIIEFGELHGNTISVCILLYTLSMIKTHCPPLCTIAVCKLMM